MKLPKTSAIVAGVLAVSAALIAWASATYHWTDVQTTATSGAAIAVVGLFGFLVEHLRKETPSRWVGVLGMIPPTLAAVVTLGIVFQWWDESATKVVGFVAALLTPLATLAGVAVAQSKVTSPETRAAELRNTAAVNQAAARRGGDGDGVPPA